MHSLRLRSARKDLHHFLAVHNRGCQINSNSSVMGAHHVAVVVWRLAAGYKPLRQQHNKLSRFQGAGKRLVCGQK